MIWKNTTVSIRIVTLSKRGIIMGGLIAFVVVLVLLVMILLSCIKIVPQANAYLTARGLVKISSTADTARNKITCTASGV